MNNLPPRSVHLLNSEPRQHPVNKTILLAAAFATIAGSPRLVAEPAPPPPPEHAPQIRLTVEFIEISLEQFTELMFGPPTPPSDAALRKQLADLAKQGKARIVETMMGTARSGTKARVESNEEFTYPTEYEPPDLPHEIHVAEDGEKTATAGRDYATPPTPTAFETRNLGPSMEWTATADDKGHYVDLNAFPQITWHTGETVWAEWNGKQGKSPIQMPEMFSLRLNLNLTLVSGQPLLAAAVSPKDDEGRPDPSRKWMVFVRCDVLK
jgi:hypothetical protein